MICRLCGSGGPHVQMSVREMMFGTGEMFDYIDCGGCGSVQIVDVPDDLARHYPADYYSFSDHGGGWLAARRDRHRLARLGVRRQDRILDVGCGSGALLDRLSRAGFSSLCGIDPFLTTSTHTPRGVPLVSSDLSEMDGDYDVIMFNHSLEHIPDPIAALKAAMYRLTSSGICLVRIPTPSSEAYRTYREDWAQLDAPRHLVIPSRWGLSVAALSAGLRVMRTIDDSTEFQFSASECYRQDIALSDPRGRDVFSRRQVRQWERRAKLLNSIECGDQATFVLCKK